MLALEALPLTVGYAPMLCCKRGDFALVWSVSIRTSVASVFFFRRRRRFLFARPRLVFVFFFSTPPGLCNRSEKKLILGVRCCRGVGSDSATMLRASGAVPSSLFPRVARKQSEAGSADIKQAGTGLEFSTLREGKTYAQLTQSGRKKQLDG